jgi:hypothetical protein
MGTYGTSKYGTGKYGYILHTPDPSLPSYMRMFESVLPPWLLRTEGVRLIGGFADTVDSIRDWMVAGIKLRFPGLYTLEGVDRIGTERRLRRGPNEDAETFAARLPRWWEDHRTRGNAYSLLQQMYVYLAGTLPPPYEVVSYRGLRHTIDADGNITRDKITWGTDETGNWARIWVFLYTTASSVTDEVMESYTAIVRDWVPAHVICKVVLIHPGTRLWGYPQPVPDWGDASWSTWGSPTIKDTREV